MASRAERIEDAARALLAVVDGREKGLRGYYIDAKRFDALRAALALPTDEAAQPAPEGAGEAVAWQNVEAALREWEGRVVIRAKMEGAKEDGIAYAREQESRALMVALGAIHAYAAHPTPRAEAALAEAVAREAARQAWVGGWYRARGTVPGLGCHVDEEAINRAVAHALRAKGAR